MKNNLVNQDIKTDKSAFSIGNDSEPWLTIPSDGAPITFTGNADDAAKEFFDALIRERDGYITTMKADRDAQQKRADALAVENAALKASLMFWDADSPDSPYDSPEEIANDLSLDYNEEFEVQVAARLTNRKYRVCETWECQCQLELVEGAEIETPATDAAIAAIRAKEHADFIAVFNEHIKTAGLDDDELVTVRECRDALKHAAELREAK